MKHYETIFIADPDLSPDVLKALTEKAQDLIAGHQGELVTVDEWGNKRLAYEVKRKMRGVYVRLDYCGQGATVEALENAFRIDDRVLKYLTVRLAETADPEALKQALADREKARRTDSTDAPASEAAKTDAAATEAPVEAATEPAAPEEPQSDQASE